MSLIDIQPLFQFHNNEIGADVDDNGVVAGADALAIINLLNSIGPTPLVALSHRLGPLHRDGNWRRHPPYRQLR